MSTVVWTIRLVWGASPCLCVAWAGECVSGICECVCVWCISGLVWCRVSCSLCSVAPFHCDGQASLCSPPLPVRAGKCMGTCHMSDWLGSSPLFQYQKPLSELLIDCCSSLLTLQLHAAASVFDHFVRKPMSTALPLHSPYILQAANVLECIFNFFFCIQGRDAICFITLLFQYVNVLHKNGVKVNGILLYVLFNG